MTGDQKHTMLTNNPGVYDKADSLTIQDSNVIHLEKARPNLDTPPCIKESTMQTYREK